jgi:hypothetical protein
MTTSQQCAVDDRIEKAISRRAVKLSLIFSSVPVGLCVLTWALTFLKHRPDKTDAIISTAILVAAVVVALLGARRWVTWHSRHELSVTLTFFNDAVKTTTHRGHMFMFLATGLHGEVNEWRG